MTVLSIPEIYDRSRKAGWQPENAAIFTAIVLAESSGNTDAQNLGGRIQGIVQINLSVHHVTALQARDPNFAFPFAYNLWRDHGFQPWEAYTGPDGKGSDGPWKDYADKVSAGLTDAQAQEIVKGPKSRLDLANSLKKLGDQIDDATDKIPGVSDLKSIGNALESVVKAIAAGIKWITDPHNWIRVGYVIVGSGLIWVGVSRLSGLPGPGSVAKIAPVV